MTVIRAERFVIKVETEPSQLPELICDVFPGVSHRAVGSNDNLIGLVLVGAGVRFKRHDPATVISSLGFEVNYAALFHQLEGALPKMQMQNFRFAREQIVTDAQAFHRVENLLDVAR